MLNIEKKKDFLLEIAKIIHDKDELDESEIEACLSHSTTALRAISRREVWIYRDWQQAIGDMMLTSIEKENHHRRFDIMGFHEFENLYLDTIQPANNVEKKSILNISGKKIKDLEFSSEHRFIQRIDALICDLDLKEDMKLDARTQQLKNLGNALIDLIVTLEKLDKSIDKIDPKRRKTMEKFEKE